MHGLRLCFLEFVRDSLIPPANETFMDAPEEIETIELCYFSIETPIGEPAVIVERAFGGPFTVKHGVEYHRIEPAAGRGKRPREIISSKARLGRVYSSIHQGNVSGYTWDLAENRDKAMTALLESVRNTLTEYLSKLQTSLDGLSIQEALPETFGPKL